MPTVGQHEVAEREEPPYMISTKDFETYRNLLRLNNGDLMTMKAVPGCI